MKDLNKLNLGIYEKALPKDIDWIERIRLVKECGYDFVETKVDPENGDVTHFYKANNKSPEKKDAVKTGANASSIITPLIALVAGGGAIGAATYISKRKRNDK